MIKAPSSLQELRRRIYRKAKSDKTHRFWGIFVHVGKAETLLEAYRIAKRNGGAPGIDGQRFDNIESAGLAAFLAELREDLLTGGYEPQPNRKVDIPKDKGQVRTLQIPTLLSYYTSIHKYSATRLVCFAPRLILPADALYATER